MLAVRRGGLPHGRVTGEIPEPKLLEFLRLAARRNQGQGAAGSGGARLADAGGPDGAVAQTVGAARAAVSGPQKDVPKQSVDGGQSMAVDDGSTAGAAVSVSQPLGRVMLRSSETCWQALPSRVVRRRRDAARIQLRHGALKS